MTRDPVRISSLFLFLAVFFSAFLLQLILPWWIVVVIGIAAGVFSQKQPWHNFLIVFSAIGLLWLLIASYITLTNSAVLLPRISGLFQLPAVWMVYVVTILVGALPASIAALGASWLKPVGS